MANKQHYVDNKRFYIEIVQLNENFQLSGEYEISDFIGKCFMDIASGLSNRPNFINYTFKEDMVGDGVENCVRYCHNFNPEKSKNPFSYFTQIIYYAFLRRIEREKKQSYIKYKMTEMAKMDELVDSDGNLNIEKSYNIYQHDFSSFEDFEKRKTSVKKEKTGKLEEFMV
tara:strand:- start:575 stop:1084 length:510 start_codon:yes stop_codon:yes gene_type:complete